VASIPVPSEDQAKLAEIRQILSSFDWETGDRQLALEEIDLIVFRGNDG
jgi:hypothetical protein